METVLEALKAMGKATYRDVAARLDIEPLVALNMLREQKEQGLCDFYDGSWSVGTAKKQAKQKATMPMKPGPRLPGAVPDPVDPDAIRQLLHDNGAMNTATLAAAVNRNARGMVSVMLAFERQCVVVKNGKGKGVTWSLPAESQLVAVQQQPESAEKTTTQIVEEIPAFTARSDDLNIPSARFISSEIRRTKTKLSNLQKLQGAVRELRRHKHLLVGLHND